MYIHTYIYLGTHTGTHTRAHTLSLTHAHTHNHIHPHTGRGTAERNRPNTAARTLCSRQNCISKQRETTEDLALGQKCAVESVLWRT